LTGVRTLVSVIGDAGDMERPHRVVRAESSERVSLEREGWRVTARSWAAQLEGVNVDRAALRAAIEAVEHLVTVRHLTEYDVDAALALDRRTLGDYPDGPASRHQALTADRARVSDTRHAWGAVNSEGDLLAVSYVDLEGGVAETDFTVVAPEARGTGLARAVKAASVLALLALGVTRFRTGGSSDNAAIIATNRSLGYIRDEEWVALVAPAL
jgi:GNAT superfamily N-acetyltransferase